MNPAGQHLTHSSQCKRQATTVEQGLFWEMQSEEKKIRAADAKEVGVGNPAEETYRYPNQNFIFNGKLKMR